MNELFDIRIGDCRDLLDKMPDRSVQCVVTSPPYWGQRDYGVEGMIGLEPDVEAWVAVMVDVFRGVHRVLKDDGTLWVNLGSKRSGSGGEGGDYNIGGIMSKAKGFGPSKAKPNKRWKMKDLIPLPWLVALALQQDGWYLRSDIIWYKSNPMPESATDRPTTTHEYMFLLSKQPRYYYDARAVQEPVSESSVKRLSQRNLPNQNGSTRAHAGAKSNGNMKAVGDLEGRSLRSVWEIGRQIFVGDHFATYPEKLVEPCIKAGSRPGDTVLDPFSGTGTTGVVAARFDRNYIGLELNPDYADMSNRRIAAAVGVRSPEKSTAMGIPVQGSMAFNIST